MPSRCAPSVFTRPSPFHSLSSGLHDLVKRWRLARRTAYLLLPACPFLQGCGDDEAPTVPEPPRIEDLVFAPELDIDLEKMTLLPSGLYVRDLVVGEGPAAETQVGARFNYEGWLHDGKPVDKGVYPPNPFFPGAFVSVVDGELYYLVGSGQTLAGWDIGLVGARVGGKRQLVIPPKLGYGANGSADGKVPPYGVLVYVFEILAVEP